MTLLFEVNKERTEAICCGLDCREFDGEVVIPSTYEGLPVTSIGTSAFLNSALSSVYIPATVTAIGMLAFMFCHNLKQVTFEENSSLKNIDLYAFDCGNALTVINFPDKPFIHSSNVFPEGTRGVPSHMCVHHFKSDRPETPPPPHIVYRGRYTHFSLNDTKDGYIADSVGLSGNIIEVPSEYNGLPVVELGERAFENSEAWKAIIPATVKKAGDFPFYGCDDMCFCVYGGTMEDWKKMRIYTWFDVHCKDGIIESDS